MSVSTPICDYVRDYLKNNNSRLHMPGHKGQSFLGCEDIDLTEITGADALYEADGIIAESEANASRLFGSAATFYSAEGSSQCIRAMLYLALLARKPDGERPLIAAGRNAHKVFVLAAALLDFDILWLWPEEENFSLCRCDISAEKLRKKLGGLGGRKPAAVYVTSPDYLGGVADIESLAKVAHEFGAPLLVDDAHGAYRKFLPGKNHPLELGADICCDSAHKTLPVITGGAYLHVSERADRIFRDEAKRALMLFGSTSPSYLILQSLDMCNRYLSEDYETKLMNTIDRLGKLKGELGKLGISIAESDPLKLSIESKAIGYDGRELALMMESKGLICEYYDPDFIVLMFTPENPERDYERLLDFYGKLEIKRTVPRPFLGLSEPKAVMRPREVAFLPGKTVKAKDSVGMVLSSPTVGCPPAVPVVVSGEEIGEDAVKIFEYYGIEELSVLP